MNDGKVFSIVLEHVVTRDLQSRRDRVRYLRAPFFYANRKEFFFLLLILFLSQKISYYKSTLLISKIILLKEIKQKGENNA